MSAPEEGLHDEGAALAELERFELSAVADPASSAQLDVAADALFASLAHAFSQGGAHPARSDPSWAIPLAQPADIAALDAARGAGAMPSALLRPLLPQSAEYAALRAELARLRAHPDEADREQHIAQVRASLERQRWLPRDVPARRIDVRIPQYELRLVTEGDAAETHKVIVGAVSTQTPSFVAEIQSVTFNPSWQPPPSIAAEELRRLRRDPSIALREGFVALDENGAPVADVDWTERPFPYRLLQRPGPANALGRIRFDLPNAYSIRLHDTSNRSLFDRERRALSHGCIRVQAPEELAAAILATPQWNVDAVNAAIETGVSRTVALSAPLPVYLAYMTVTTDDAGQIAYAQDVYHRDAAVVAALDAPDVALAGEPVATPILCTQER